MPEPRFRPCRQNQPMLLPPDISDLIPANAMARLVDAVVGRMDRRPLESLYPGGGAPARDPAMMLKVVPFCYASGIYSSRKIAAATRENVNLMWLTGMEPLDHNMVNRFRTERVRPVFEDVLPRSSPCRPRRATSRWRPTSSTERRSRPTPTGSASPGGRAPSSTATGCARRSGRTSPR
ncbi:transposase [Collinsella tanakaei]|uniref:transposase n=1 Tax=Collinsella tanakaei TaxID=626935 RepID=UPI0019599380|nr:transposase [Collinsella tanakaei]MBM6756548.1 transposase [Collinsella tanakaei]